MVISWTSISPAVQQSLTTTHWVSRFLASRAVPSTLRWVEMPPTKYGLGAQGLQDTLDVGAVVGAKSRLDHNVVAGLRGQLVYDLDRRGAFQHGNATTSAHVGGSPGGVGVVRDGGRW